METEQIFRYPADPAMSAAAPTNTETPLDAMGVVFLDCQATGATPKHGHLLEMAWSRGDARTLKEAPSSHLVSLPTDATLSNRVSEITGIRREDLAGALPAGDVFRRLVDWAGTSRPIPTVIHFARFERPFLEALHDQHDADAPFPFDIVCTHDLCRRLLPSLPRRGLRAMAGYFGHVLMDEHKRAGDHVAATATVWQAVVSILARRGVHTLSDLRAYLQRPIPPKPKQRRYPFPRAKRLALPERPGVYRMLARSGAVLYVGKATSVKQRFNTYFRQKWKGDERKLELLTQVVDVRVTETASPLEAALLEADEIKALAPPYNKALRRREANCWFVSPQDGTATEAPEGATAVGPLPNRDALEPLFLLQAELRRRSRPTGQDSLDWSGFTGRRRRMEILGPLWGAAPDASTFDSGLEGALVRAGVQDARLCSAATLLRGGARLYRLLREEATDRVVDAVDDALVLTPPKNRRARPIWTPQRVQDAVEKSWSRAAHLWRRAQWLCRLSDAVITWRPSTSGDDDTRTLIVEAGRVSVAPRGSSTVPPGHARSLCERRECFDRDTYDRLRVLTTELRRLCAEGSEVSVHLDSRITWHRGTLSRILSWV